MLLNRLGSEFSLGSFDSGLLIIIEFKIAPGMVAWRYRYRAVKKFVCRLLFPSVVAAKLMNEQQIKLDSFSWLSQVNALALL